MEGGSLERGLDGSVKSVVEVVKDEVERRGERTGGVEFEIFLEICVPQIALGLEIREGEVEEIRLWTYLCVDIHDDVVASIGHVGGVLCS